MFSVEHGNQLMKRASADSEQAGGAGGSCKAEGG
jgi:hypothetical protein